MEEQFVIVNLRTQFVFVVRFVVAAVEKSAVVFFPGRTRELDPVDRVWTIFSGLHVAHFPLLPIGTGGCQSVSEKFRVIANLHAAQSNGPVFGENVWIEKLMRRLGQIRGRVKNILVLQS